MRISYLLVLVVAVIYVDAKCSDKIIKNIKKSFNGKPPTELAQKLKKIVVWLTAPPFLPNTSNIACYMSLVYTAPAVVDIVFYENQLRAELTEFPRVQEFPGHLNIKGENGTYDRDIYIVYLSKSVVAAFECQETDQENFPAYAMIGVININSNEEGKGYIQKEIKKAQYKLKKVGLKTLGPIKSDCD